MHARSPRSVSAFAAAALLIIGLVSPASASSQAVPTEPELRVAFLGDSGTGSNARAVLNLVKSENADLVIHPGDMGYDASPGAWEDMVNDILGPDFPYVYTVGNHDVEDGNWPDYRDRLAARVNRVDGLDCTGDLGVKSWCTYGGLWFLQSGVGELGSGHDAYIREQCGAADHVWKVTAWHKNQRAMQLGGKEDGTGWPVYEESRKCGAVIATAHEHSYGRTRTLTSTSSQTVDSSCGDAAKVCVDPGRSFVFYSGLGGRSIRDQERCLPTSFPYGCKQEWAKAYTSDQGAKDGALFVTFHVDGDPNKAHGRFKNTSGEVVDEFTITTGGTTVPGSRYEAEDAVCQGSIDSNHAGFSGTGFCNTDNAVGKYAEWTVEAASAGPRTLTFRYANDGGSDRPVDVAVNGTTAVAGLSFPRTGAWSSWSTVTTTVDLAAGTNTIRATATNSGGAANLDYLELD